MSLLQAIILITGAILFTVSFFIQGKQSEVVRDKEMEEKLIKEAIEKEIEGFRYQLEEAAEDAVSHTKDTTERHLDRITNEKMNAISEYSDTVMEQIHKNHEETVFLYDMLNNKHAQIKNTTAELNNAIRSAKEVKDSVPASAPQPTVAKETKTQDVAVNTAPSADAVKEEKTFESLTLESIPLPMAEPEERSANKRNSGASNKKSASKKKSSGVEVMFASDGAETNNNDKILALHKEGKSNMAIARELGLGIGEVKLVIDLFEGIG